MKSVSVTLPCAIQQLDGQWTKEIEICPMVGSDEDIIADQTREGKGKGTFARSGSRRMTEVLSRCTLRIGAEGRPEGKDRKLLPNFFLPHWERAFSSDRIFSMIRLRQLTLGDTYATTYTCPACGKELKGVSVDLSTLKVHDIPLEVAALPGHDVTLPESGDRVTWKFVTGAKDEELISEASKTMRAEFISAVMYRRILAVNGSKPDGGLDYLKDMHSKDRRFLANHVDQVEGGIETDLQIRCDECRVEFTRKIEVMTGDFFFPSET